MNTEPSRRSPRWEAPPEGGPDVAVFVDSEQERHSLLGRSEVHPAAAAARSKPKRDRRAVVHRRLAYLAGVALAAAAVLRVYVLVALQVEVPAGPGLAFRGPKPRYTVRMNTFRRNDLLEQALKHWRSCGTEAVAEITVIWSDTEREPPPLESLGVESDSGVPVRYVERALLLVLLLLLGRAARLRTPRLSFRPPLLLHYYYYY